MNNYHSLKIIGKRLSVCLVLSTLAIMGIHLVGQALASPAYTAKTLDRTLEPVIIEGSQAGDLIGAPIEQLFVYTYTGTGWGGQIPFQADEKKADGSYIAFEDGQLDANDELVFMAKDLGHEAPNTAPPNATLPISATWYTLEVTDPLAPSKKGWAYLVQSASLSSTVNEDYVHYNAASQRLTADQYQLEFATSHAGLENFFLNGSSTDILDRIKLRVIVDTFFGSFTFTEDSLGMPPGSEPVLVKDGRVRVILRQIVQQSFISGSVKANLTTTYLAYAALFQGIAAIDFTVSGLEISSVRTSVDLDSGVANSPTTFFNANALGGVTINGNPEAIAATPRSNWSQVSHPTGRLIYVANPLPAGGTQENFYRDNSVPETPDTGQPGSYGESGFLFSGDINKSFSIQSSFFILPPASGGSNNVGPTYEQYFFNPLTTIPQLLSDFPNVFLPIIVRH